MASPDSKTRQMKTLAFDLYFELNIDASKVVNFWSDPEMHVMGVI